MTFHSDMVRALGVNLEQLSVSASWRQLRRAALSAARRGYRFEADAGSTRIRSPVPPELGKRMPTMMFLITWAAEWSRLAFPTLQLSHRFAAAMMATSPPPGEIRAPWPFFAISVPDNLLHIALPDGTAFPINRLGCVHLNAQWSYVACAGGVELYEFHRSTDYLRTGELPDGVNKVELTDDLFGTPTTSQDERVQRCLSRLLLNSCAMINEQRGVRPVGKSHSRNPGTPITEDDALIYEIGTPIKIDCREAVRDYVSGRRRNAPSVRWLVRGHWTHQVHGPGSTLRRLQWIEPYWAGRENIVTKVRNHAL